ncbi:MAG: GIY-YIG nuclease family protein [Bacteroidota bacterium]
MGSWNHNYYLYMMTNRHNTVLYTGMTNDLLNRTQQHRSLKVPGFTSRYRITKLVYYEHFTNVTEAIQREKQVKSWSRAKKEKLIESLNPEWVDLYDSLIDD